MALLVRLERFINSRRVSDRDKSRRGDVYARVDEDTYVLGVGLTVRTDNVLVCGFIKANCIIAGMPIISERLEVRDCGMYFSASSNRKANKGNTASRKKIGLGY